MKQLKDVAIVKDSAKFLDNVLEERNLSRDSAVIRAVPDGGGGSFKVMV